MNAGRGFGGWQKGAIVAGVSNVERGMILLEHSKQFDADNTLRVSRVADERFYAQFIDEDGFIALNEMCIWGWEIGRCVDLWIASAGVACA